MKKMTGLALVVVLGAVSVGSARTWWTFDNNDTEGWYMTYGDNQYCYDNRLYTHGNYATEPRVSTDYSIETGSVLKFDYFSAQTGGLEAYFWTNDGGFYRYNAPNPATNLWTTAQISLFDFTEMTSGIHPQVGNVVNSLRFDKYNSGGGVELGLDNISFLGVPEPATISLFALAALAFVRSRK